ncbi:MAG: RNB domain-containing ribonuclease, partial [Lachnospiraceae bacterium]|nr:RNB domain-containing ribonuclease [Lachnospiraceae bacterium]
EVSALLEDRADDALKQECSELIPMFRTMAQLSALIRKRRKQHGAIDFDFPEPKAILDENGYPVDIYPYKRSVATDMIEDFMLAANETIANVAFWENLPFLYRNHEAPAEDKMEEFVSFLGGFGIALHLQTEVHPKKLQQVLDVTAREAEGPLIHRVLLRCMKQARYGNECLGHFGLAMEHYTHFTSPIRRYPDLQIHRILKAGLDADFSESRLGEIATHCSSTERKAAEAEREVMKYFKAVYMQSEIGRIHKGVISGVTNGGIYVELYNTVEGVIRLTSLNDHYVLDETHYRLVGERSGKTFVLGQRVKVEVLDVDLTMAQVVFGLVSEDKKRRKNDFDPSV